MLYTKGWIREAVEAIAAAGRTKNAQSGERNWATSDEQREPERNNVMDGCAHNLAAALRQTDTPPPRPSIDGAKKTKKTAPLSGCRTT